MAGDLEHIGVHKVGDQLLLHDAIQALRDVKIVNLYFDDSQELRNLKL